MRNALPKRARRVECGIVNLDSSTGMGSHWTCWIKNNNRAFYFDSFGNLRPPKELIRYLQSFGPCAIQYNHDSLQNYTDVNCGHLVLNFLFQHTRPFSF